LKSVNNLVYHVTAIKLNLHFNASSNALNSLSKCAYYSQMTQKQLNCPFTYELNNNKQIQIDVF